ncbi:zinc finger protein 180-like isoform X2 [Drosophila subobscura]|uniref:zinc finger protein 180-like isoform X2 n=1 Tax=Drosophila subobscura TaxID=7241 RepID=UPI00155AAC28|nr:zinc finger protein 180-like isoform X2 [Drosophila subobscura]
MFCVKTNHSDQRTINSAYLEIEESGTRAMEETCRVCKGTSESFTNIFDEPQKWDTCIADMISECTGYAVRRGDLLSEKICLHCLEDAVSAFNLKKTCEQSHKHYFTLTVEDNVKNVVWELSESENARSKCFGTAAKIHINFAAESQRQQRPFLGVSTASLHPHMNERTNSGHGPHQSELNEHTCIPTVEMPHKCPHCSKSFGRSDSLRIHVRSHTGERPYQCPHCYRSFNKEEPLQIHISTHKGDRPFKCSLCSQSFHQKSHLREHSRLHTGERTHTCSYCPKSFKKKSKLDRHTLTHTDERPFRCAQCSKSFQEKSNLRVHIRSHTGERPYQCIHCSKKFRYRNNSYQRHLLSHTSNEKWAIPGLKITSVRSLENETIASTASRNS